MSLTMLILKGLFEYMLQTLHCRCHIIAQATLVLRMDMFLVDYMNWVNGIIKNLIFLTLKLPYHYFQNILW